MKSVYGKICSKHPELAGRRYVPGHGCIKCRNESSKRNNEKLKAERKARDERLAKCEALLREVIEYDDNAIEPLLPLALYLTIEEVLGNDPEPSA